MTHMKLSVPTKMTKMQTASRQFYGIWDYSREQNLVLPTKSTIKVMLAFVTNKKLLFEELLLPTVRGLGRSF